MHQKAEQTATRWKRARAGVLVMALLVCWTGMASADDAPESATENGHYYRNGSAPPLSQLSITRAVSRTLADLQTPLETQHVNSEFGWRKRLFKTSRKSSRQRFHYGVDYGAPRGTPVHVALDGIIQAIGKKRGFGDYIRVLHENGVETAYAHMVSFVQGLKRGDKLSTGDVIGYVGKTGRATGPHLHYEVLVNGVPVDPENTPREPNVPARAQAAGRRFSAAFP